MFGGVQRVYEHQSEACACPMRFGAFLPDGLKEASVPTLFWLSGLTCTEQNFVTKAGAQRVAAALGVIIIAPDTSPRGEGVADDPEGAYDMGLGAGFYLNATQEPWAKHYRMDDYIARELPSLVGGALPINLDRLGVFGHSMGGHGALTMHLKHPGLFKSVSAFAPIVAPSSVPWGKKAFTGYLGEDDSAWADYDATKLVAAAPSDAHILIDQGSADQFLDEQLRPSLFEKACKEAGQSLTLRMQEGYDHSYYFMATFIEDHIRHHAKALGA